MARINIASHLHADKRFLKLILKLGNKWTALGALTEAWEQAHKFHSIQNPNGLIPREKWLEQECCEDIIAVKLARIEGEFVYMHGAIEQFKSLLDHKKRASNGGKTKARNRQNSLKNEQKNESQEFKPPLSPGLAAAKPPLTTSSSSSSSSCFFEADHHRAGENANAVQDDDDDDCCTTLRFGGGEVDDDEKVAAENSVTDLLSAMFAGPVPQDIRRAAPQMLAKFDGDPEAVKAHLTELWQNPKVRGEDEQITNRPGYLRVALLNHFGLSEVEK